MSMNKYIQASWLLIAMCLAVTNLTMDMTELSSESATAHAIHIHSSIVLTLSLIHILTHGITLTY